MRALFVHVHRPLARNMSTLPRPQPLLAAGHAPPLFLEHITHQ
jgi:hypothetical protein